MIVRLDDQAALDPARVGAKAAALARARQTGLPVAPGFVVEASASLGHLRIGAAALGERGSGGARLAVSSAPVSDPGRIVAAASDLSPLLAVRSSSPLESDGTWAGAFTSYLDIKPDELPKAVTGCWASVFSVDAIARHVQAGLEPGSVPMAVLVQPAIAPVVSGVAEIAGDGKVLVEAVTGPPAALLGGWRRGALATRRPGQGWEGGEGISLVGTAVLDEIGAALASSGHNRCEWGAAGSLWLFQLGKAANPPPMRMPAPAPSSPELIPLVRAVITAPGALGTEMVLPWALAGLPKFDPIRPRGHRDLLERALDLSQSLTSQVWGLPPAEAISAARALLADLRGPSTDDDIARIRTLKPPDPVRASRLLSTIRAIGEALVANGAIPDTDLVWHLSAGELRSALRGDKVTLPSRVGTTVWEPLTAAVVLDHGVRHQGVPASGGVGAGRRHFVDGEYPRRPSPRGVITAAQALPNLSQTIWDAAGVVTGLGSPSAHLFEVARSHGVPAVCGVDLESRSDQIIAVDGYSGVVATMPLEPGL